MNVLDIYSINEKNKIFLLDTRETTPITSEVLYGDIIAGIADL